MAKIARHFSRKLIDDVELRRLWSSHLSEETLAKKMGHHRSTIRRRAVKIGLPSSRRRLWQQEEERP